MKVHLLVTCLDPARIRSSLLVFKTLRVGFPTAQVVVYSNGLDNRVARIIANSVDNRTKFIPIQNHTHGEWIEKLVETEHDPFWICDTDVVFFGKVEDWFRNELFAGRFEPEFHEPWTGMTHVERLHPSLMWFNPAKLRAELRAWPHVHEFFSSVEANLFRWNWVPEKGQVKFYDTCAGLYHALEGTRFDEVQCKTFSHLFCGSYAHLCQHYQDLTRVHDAAFVNPESVRNLKQLQDNWYAQSQGNGTQGSGETMSGEQRSDRLDADRATVLS